MFIPPTTCARYAYEQGINTIRTVELRRGRTLVGIAMHYRGDKAKLTAANIVHTTAKHHYAPEIVEQVARMSAAAQAARMAEHL